MGSKRLSFISSFLLFRISPANYTKIEGCRNNPNLNCEKRYIEPIILDSDEWEKLQTLTTPMLARRVKNKGNDLNLSLQKGTWQISAPVEAPGHSPTTLKLFINSTRSCQLALSILLKHTVSEVRNRAISLHFFLFFSSGIFSFAIIVRQRELIAALRVRPDFVIEQPPQGAASGFARLRAVRTGDTALAAALVQDLKSAHVRSQTEPLHAHALAGDEKDGASTALHELVLPFTLSQVELQAGRELAEPQAPGTLLYRRVSGTSATSDPFRSASAAPATEQNNKASGGSGGGKNDEGGSGIEFTQCLGRVAAYSGAFLMPRCGM